MKPVRVWAWKLRHPVGWWRTSRLTKSLQRDLIVGGAHLEAVWWDEASTLDYTFDNPEMRMVGKVGDGWVRTHLDGRPNPGVNFVTVDDPNLYSSSGTYTSAPANLYLTDNTSMTSAGELIEKLARALDFYADPDTYFAVAVVGDPPCGEFVNDFSEVDGEMRPGRRAREALGLED